MPSEPPPSQGSQSGAQFKWATQPLPSQRPQDGEASINSDYLTSAVLDPKARLSQNGLHHPDHLRVRKMTRNQKCALFCFGGGYTNDGDADQFCDRKRDSWAGAGALGGPIKAGAGPCGTPGVQRHAL